VSKDKKKILFVDILTDDPKFRRFESRVLYGGSSYAESVRRALGVKKEEFLSIDASRGVFPDLSRFKAVILGGSIEDPIRGKEKKWMKETYVFIRKIAREKIPMLGICGGLQFTVRALGGIIILNPKGRNFRTNKTTLTSAGMRDPLFRGLPPTFSVQSSHKCIVQRLKPGWKLLASSPYSPFDAIAIGGAIRLLEFHPEMRVSEMRGIARMRKAALKEEGYFRAGDFGKLLLSFKETGRNGKKILNNFLGSFVR